MALMSFNQFQRELKNRGIEGHTAYMLTLMFEQMIELSKETEAQSGLILALANSMQGLAELNEHNTEGLRRVMRDRQPDGISVQSVANEPEDD